MKPYSIDRYAHQTCRYGCCKNPKGSKHLATRRRQKRMARAEGRRLDLD